MNRRGFLKTVGIGGPVTALALGTPFKASAEEYNNPSYFGGALLRDAGKKMFEGQTPQDILNSLLAYNGPQSIYTASNVANAFVSAWREAEGTAVDRIVNGAKDGDLSAFDALISGRRDQGLLETINYQHSNIIVEALRDVDQRQGLRRGFDQIADEGIKTLISALNSIRDHENYEGYKASFEEVIAYAQTAYIEGANMFANGLRADLTKPAQPDAGTPGALPRIKLNDI